MKFRNLIEVYEASTKAYAERPLFGTKKNGSWHWMTYGEFRTQVEALRGGLAALGVQRGDRVAIIANNRPEWAIAAYATYGLGACFVPMYESQLPKDWKFILENSGAKVVFVANESIRDKILDLKDEINPASESGHPKLPAGSKLSDVVVIDGQANDMSMTFAGALRLGEEKPAEIFSPDPSDIAGLIYTSGTTGNPKGVLLSHSNFAGNVSAIHAILPMSVEDRSLSFLPWAHSFGQTVELHGLFSLGASMGIAEAVDKIVDNLAEIKPTLLISVPRIFNRIYDGLHKKMNEAGGLKKALFDAAVSTAVQRKKLAADGKSSAIVDFKFNLLDKIIFSKVRDRFGGRLKYAFSGGAALNKDVAEFIDNLGITIYEGYGLSETSPIATANTPDGRKIGSIGRAIPGVTVEIDTTATGEEEQGEIVVSGHNVMQGYYGLPEENKKVFFEKDGKTFFRTGDMARMDDKGFVYITGRIKEQYKLLNGKYVVPTPLEGKMKLSPFISNVMVYGMNRNYNVAVVVPDFESLDKWAADNGISKDRDVLVDDSRVKKLFEDEIEKHTAGFKSYEKVRDFGLGTVDFTTENGMLTPTLKLKRRAVIKHYDGLIESLYAE